MFELEFNTLIFKEWNTREATPTIEMFELIVDSVYECLNWSLIF